MVEASVWKHLSPWHGSAVRADEDRKKSSKLGIGFQNNKEGKKTQKQNKKYERGGEASTSYSVSGCASLLSHPSDDPETASLWNLLSFFIIKIIYVNIIIPYPLYSISFDTRCWLCVRCACSPPTPTELPICPSILCDITNMMPQSMPFLNHCPILQLIL